MTFLAAALLGALQGVAEFLPISSSGHLSLAQYFLGLEDTPRFFDIMLHLGTLAAVLLYYRRSLLPPEEPADVVRSASRRWLYWGALVLLATLPAVAAGVVFRPTKIPPGQTLESVDRGWRNQVGDLREYSSQRPAMIAAFLVCTGALLVYSGTRKPGVVGPGGMRWTHALAMGLAQAVSALCPGLSRSGLTVSVGLLLGLRGDWAVHFSLLMSIPAVLGAALLKSR
ncbi:MAG: undecaprenyl-diphosphate phosphatase, partial [Planctomycetia bacterium]